MAKEPSAALQFIVDCLKRSPDHPYAEIAAKAVEHGHKVFPIMYGRAKLLLGLVKKGEGIVAARKRGDTQARTRRQRREKVVPEGAKRVNRRTIVAGPAYERRRPVAVKTKGESVVVTGVDSLLAQGADAKNKLAQIRAILES